MGRKGRAAHPALLARPARLTLFEVLVHQLRHFEHVDGRLAAENRLQAGVRVDHPPVLLVLQAVLLDVGPQPFGDLGAWNRLRADDFRDGRIRRNRPHEGRIRRTLASTSLLLRSRCRFPRSLLGHVISSAYALRARRDVSRATPARMRGRSRTPRLPPEDPFSRRGNAYIQCLAIAVWTPESLSRTTETR